MKELSLYHKIAFAVLCAGAFTNTLTLIPSLTLIRVALPLTLCLLLFTERVRLDSSFYAVCAFYFAYITYTLLITLAYGRDISFPDIANFLFILPLVITALWFFYAAPRDSLKILYWVCIANLFVSLAIATVEMATGWHLSLSNMHIPEKVYIVTEHNKNYPTGFFHNKNDFAVVVTLTLCYILTYRILFMQNRRKWMDLLLFVPGMAVLCMVRGRTALAAVLLFLLFTQRQRLLKHKVFLSIIGGVCMVALIVVFCFTHTDSSSTRFSLYFYSFASLFDSYCLGFGLHGDSTYFTSFDNYTLFSQVSNAHSYLFEMLLTSGFFFFMAYIALLIYVMRNIAKNHGRDEFWAMVPLYVFLLFAPSSSLYLWIHYLFFSAMMGYAIVPASQNETLQKREQPL